ncbi:hypothetical protein KCU98_g7563, partial [Aureobasidium melanogenum]
MLTYRNDVFITVLAFYTFTGVFCIIRLIQYGLRKTASERILLVFSIGRILCAAFQLATITYPTNTSIWAGYITTFSICVSLLLSASLGRDSMKLCQIFVTIGLVLGIAGGIKADNNWGSTGSYHPDGIQKASIVIFIMSWALVVFLTIHTLGRAHGASSHTQRIAVAVFAISLPLLAVRIAYSAVSIFANLKSFSSVYGSVTIMLCMALIEEAIIVLMYEVLGFVTLETDKRTKSVASDFDQFSATETGVYADWQKAFLKTTGSN